MDPVFILANNKKKLAVKNEVEEEAFCCLKSSFFCFSLLVLCIEEERRSFVQLMFAAKSQFCSYHRHNSSTKTDRGHSFRWQPSEPGRGEDRKSDAWPRNSFRNFLHVLMHYALATPKVTPKVAFVFCTFSPSSSSCMTFFGSFFFFILWLLQLFDRLDSATTTFVCFAYEKSG